MPKIILRYLQITKIILKSKFCPSFPTTCSVFSLWETWQLPQIMHVSPIQLAINTVDCISEMFQSSALSSNFIFFSAIVFETILSFR